MPMEPQCFIHAANVRLDVPVSVQTAESLTDDIRLAFEDATIDSFDYVIDQCLARRVDYLLLSGNVFIESERSLRARLALLNGFQKLCQAAISVVVIPGLSDPSEAWRAIPDMPANVSICYSAQADPIEIRRNDVLIATVTAASWYGEPDSFGIQVIGTAEDVSQPFRIGSVSESGYEEARRMAAITREHNADAVDININDGANDVDLRRLTDNDLVRDDVTEPELNSDESLSLEVIDVTNTAHNSSSNKRSSDSQCWGAGFVRYIDESFREGRLNYLALMGGLTRATLRRGSNVVHAPGTTQPRHARESDRGTCSFVEVAASGEVSIVDLNTSSVDWKTLEIHVDPLVTLSGLLQQMKTLLSRLDTSQSDCIWAIGWTLRGALPVLQSLQEEDLDVAVAVELDVLELDDGSIELLHSIRIVPDRWSLDDPGSLGQQYAESTSCPDLGRSRRLRAAVLGDRGLTDGWKQRLLSLLPAVDGERVVGQMRTDGASWFVDDPAQLMPQLLSQLVEQPEIVDEDTIDTTAMTIENAWLEREDEQLLDGDEPSNGDDQNDAPADEDLE
jgi:DNA repair protein SbcD/Mre11